MSFRDQVVAVITAQPGSSAARIKEALEELGVTLAKNEPASTLHVLKGQGRVRHEGDWPARVYFAVEGAVAPAHGGSKPKAERTPSKRRPAKAQAELDPHNARAIPDAKPATLASATDILRQELADVIVKHLGEDDGWDTAEQIASDLAEPRLAVNLALSDLMKASRVCRRADATGRWVYRDKREGDEVQVAHRGEPAPVLAPDAVEADARTQAAEPVSSNGNSGPESFMPTPEAPTVAHGGAVTLDDVLSRMKRALADSVPVDLPYAIGLEIDALDDLMGDACDMKVPHGAIKALVVASSSLRRAVAALQSRAA